MHPPVSVRLLPRRRPGLWTIGGSAAGLFEPLAQMSAPDETQIRASIQDRWTDRERPASCSRASSPTPSGPRTRSSMSRMRRLSRLDYAQRPREGDSRPLAPIRAFQTAQRHDRCPWVKDEGTRWESRFAWEADTLPAELLPLGAATVIAGRAPRAAGSAGLSRARSNWWSDTITRS